MKRNVLLALGLSVGLSVTTYAAPPTCQTLTESYLAADRLQDMGAAEVPEEVRAAAEKYGTEYGISPEFIMAICWQESRFQPNVTGGSCIGLMQIHPNSHRGRMKRLGVSDLYDVDQNVHTGTDYLAELFSSNPDPATVLMMYNGDTTNLRAGKVSKYASRILELTQLYELEEGE